MTVEECMLCNNPIQDTLFVRFPNKTYLYADCIKHISRQLDSVRNKPFNESETRR